MHELQASRVSLHQVDAGYTAVVYLLEELPEVCAALMPDPCFGEETATGSALVDADAQVYVLTEAHGRKATQLTVETAANAKVEGTRIELSVHLLLAAANAARGKEGGHAVTDGFLHRCEAVVSSVRSTPCVAVLPLEFVIDSLEEPLRQDAIAVEEDEELTLAVFCSEVARQARAAVLFRVVAKLQLPRITADDVLARLAGTVLYDDDFHVLERLLRKALEKLIDFIRTVIYGNYD